MSDMTPEEVTDAAVQEIREIFEKAFAKRASLARPAPQPVGVKVKPLVWEQPRAYESTFYAKTPFGTWAVWEIGGHGYVCRPDARAGRKVDGGIEGAKLAAMGDVEEIVASALDPQPARTFTEDEVKAAVASVASPLSEELGSILKRLDDALEPEDGGPGMHTGGQTPDWFVRAAHMASYWVPPGCEPFGTDALKRVTEAAEAKGRREALAAVADADEALDGEPEYHYQGMGCGLEDRCITDRYEAMKFGWDQAMERVYSEHINPAKDSLGVFRALLKKEDPNDE